MQMKQLILSIEDTIQPESPSLLKVQSQVWHIFWQLKVL